MRLDRFLPSARLVQTDHVDVAASPEMAYRVAKEFDLAALPLAPALFRAQRVSELQMLADEPGVAFAVGAIGKPWRADVPYFDVPAEDFASFDQPGFAKVAWEVRFVRRGTSTRIVLELRADATDDRSWRRFRRYLALFGPWSHLVRRHALERIARELGTPDAAEHTRPMPGDEILEKVRAQITRGITIEAPVTDVWPWLVQMGAGRGGWYSYDVLDGAGRPSAARIQPELQSLNAGDLVPTSRDGRTGYYVARIEPPRVLVLESTADLEHDVQVRLGDPIPPHYWRATWAFELEPLDAVTTRLHVRARVDYEPEGQKLRMVWLALVHRFMEAEQLRHLKKRAERPTDGARAPLPN